ncbi:hypothetical protein [Streptomyces sp. NPDC096013]|uniref:hypothetical protein n=1 Tax=Streptomyces sp. NPDC096013 TaxID=3366069 RepID=UPI0038109212
MTHGFDHSDRPAVTAVFLAAEAALLTERVRMLREHLDDVDARIQETADRLRRRSAPCRP